MSNNTLRKKISFKEVTKTSNNIANVCIQTMINSDEELQIFKNASFSGYTAFKLNFITFFNILNYRNKI